ncbi:RNA ligase family protein [Mesorhizobium sp.]|uniref:ATP-dependent DNA ligase n=1 Tax=Mesorhizobium sp. TaxID=1871066 RepID=UPI000FE7471B|nr:RNA ligase family protein [Mesorhizobium sp.]RWI35450.1 MAG: hypothetical protein EOR14_28525 [Mesorhizobium sp.]RWJ66381.1 MAG: hypothetical protein EOR34_28610 [Mesorhizobium sp.]
MSDAYKVWSIIRTITDTGSRLEKEKLLAELADLELGRFVLKWTYDPFVTYGLTAPAPDDAVGLNMQFRQSIVEPLLTQLSKRTLTGHAAARETAEVMGALDKAGREILFRILSKDLKCGVAAATINQAVPGLVPVFSVMRAHHFEEKRIKSWPQFVEPKYDGYRYTFLCRNGEGGFFSRNGIRQPAADHLVEPMIETALNAYQGSVANGTDLHKLLSNKLDNRGSMNFMVDGEMMMPGDFNATGALRRKDEQATDAFFQVFDIMSYADFDAVGSVGKPYKERRKLVEEFVSYSVGPAIAKSERYFVNSFEEIYDLYEKFRARKLEGAMVKNPDGLYDKKKSYGWMKIKPEETEDLRIIGWFEGKPHTKLEGMFAGFLVDRNGVEVRVGGGFSDDLREECDKECKAKTAGQEPVIERGIKKRYFDGGRLAEVEFAEVTPDGSLRHPRFIRFRDDKDGELESKEAA